MFAPPKISDWLRYCPKRLAPNGKVIFLPLPKIQRLIASECQTIEAPKNSVKVRNDSKNRRMPHLTERQLLFLYLFYWVHGEKRVKDADDVSRDHPQMTRLIRLSGPRKVSFDRLHSPKALSFPHRSGILRSLERSSDQSCSCEKEALGQTSWCQTHQQELWWVWQSLRVPRSEMVAKCQCFEQCVRF